MRGEPFIARPAMLRATDTTGIGGKCAIDAAKQWHCAIANYPEDLQEILSRYRILRWRQAQCPSRDSVRETLKQLARIPKRETTKRWKNLDEKERARIRRASKWQNLDEAVKVEIRRAAHSITCPANLPEAAKNALDSMEHKQAGRTINIEATVLFAAALARYWHETTKQIPTAYGWTDSNPSAFQTWAEPLFVLAGYSVGDIPKHLQAGIKKSGVFSPRD